MNRRGFLGTLIAVAVAPFMPTPKPRLLWVNTEARHVDRNRLAEQYRMGVREYADMPDWYQQVRVGDTITVKLPARFKKATA